MRLIALLLLAALVAVLALTNPTHDDFGDFLSENAGTYMDGLAPGLGGLLDRFAGRTSARLAAEAFERENYLVCSVYRLDLSGGRLENAEFAFLGIAGRFIPLKKPDDVRIRADE